MDRIREYLYKCQILRQIQSNKACKFRRINNCQNIATVVVSGFITFMGFSGLDKIHTYLNWLLEVDKIKVEFSFNCFVFLLFLLVILHLVFQFGYKQAEAERAIVFLSNLVNEIEDLSARYDAAYDSNTLGHCEIIRSKYESIISTIPPNTDSEFKKARLDYQKKEDSRSSLRIGAQDIFEESRQKNAILSLVSNSTSLMEILRAIRQVDPKLHLGGGLVRNAVWDYLHGYRTPTPVEDVDVIYFDQLSSTKDHDTEVEKKLQKILPNVRWSVKNQARMHIFNSDSPYTSLEDAISKWPETATSFLVRLEPQGEISLMAPFGFSDLFRLIVVPTPHFKSKVSRILQRAENKKWTTIWPRLRIIATEIDYNDKEKAV